MLKIPFLQCGHTVQPFSHGVTYIAPSKLLMKCKIRSNVPQAAEAFIPKWTYLAREVSVGHHSFQTETEERLRQASHSYICPLQNFQMMRKFGYILEVDRLATGHVAGTAEQPKSYIIVQIPQGQVC